VSLNDELIAIRLELKGQRETVTGMRQVVEAEKGLGTATTRTGTAAEKAEKKTSRLSQAYSRLGRTAKLGLGFLGVSGVFALEKAVDASQDLAMATSGLTRNFGFNTNVASRWAAVMHGRSVEPKALTMAFATLSSKMVEAGRTGGTALTAFHQLGMTQDEVVRGSKNFEWGLLRVADALGEEEGGAKRSTAAKALLGKGFQTLTPLFSEGVEGLKEQLRWADKYGVTLSTTTKDGLMDMVVAGRESKVAMLGLQIAMTKAMMPAIEEGQAQLHRFIATLNDPDLSADQKLHRIEGQFLHLEDTLIQVITDALPRVAEHGGELGVKLAGAIWHGFRESDLEGKLIIGAWVFSLFGGWGLVKTGARKVGGKIGTQVGIGLGAGVIGAFIAYEVWESLSDKSKAGVLLWADQAATDFTNFFVRKLNDRMDEANVLSFLGVDAPNIGEVESQREQLGAPPVGSGTAPNLGRELFEGKGGNARKRRAYESLWGQPPPPGPPPWPPPKRPNRPAGRVATPTLPRLNLSGLGGAGRPIVIPITVDIDGEKVAQTVAHHTLAAEATG
jgi:hypothetical protein